MLQQLAEQVGALQASLQEQMDNGPVVRIVRVAETERKVMRLHIVSGSFFPAGDGAGGGCPMDAAVWSRLPDDIMWQVLRFVPAAKRFQLHSVSIKWRRELTSARFRSTCTISDTDEQQQQRVVACVTPAYGDTNHSKLKVAEVDLSFVPDSFWNPARKGCCSYSVVATGDGLVCISNDFTEDPQHPYFKKEIACPSCVPEHPCWENHSSKLTATRTWPTQYCLLNPLTRTCVVLPSTPFRAARYRWLLRTQGQPAAAAVTIYGWDKVHRGAVTCDLTLAAGTGGGGGGGPGLRRWTLPHRSPAVVTRDPDSPPVVVQCAGETFWYKGGRLHVLLALPGPASVAVAKPLGERREEEGEERQRLLEAVDAVDSPSVELLGLDPASVGYMDREVYLVAHRGAVFFVAELSGLTVCAYTGSTTYTTDPKLGAGVWRLTRSQMAWEAVSRVDAGQAQRLVAGATHARLQRTLKGWRDLEEYCVCGAFVVRDLLCCQFKMYIFTVRNPRLKLVVLGLDVDTGEWKLVLGDKGVMYDAQVQRCADINPVELRPDLYLS